MTHSNTSTPILEDVINNYLEAGWPMVTAMPQGKKFPPLSDNTGRKVFHARQIGLAGYEWDETNNLGLVLATEDSAGFDLIALDVDQYNDKTGADNLEELEEELGSLDLYNVVRSTRRGIDSRSAQYFFKAPKGYEYEGKACAGVEIVQAHHRFSAVYPSVVDGMGYRWYLGQDEAEIPNVDDLPWLPEAWLDHLIKGNAKDPEHKANVANFGTAVTWLKARVMGGAAEALEVDWGQSSPRHDIMHGKVRQLVCRAVFNGRPGLIATLKKLQRDFTHQLKSTGDFTPGREGEFKKSVVDAVGYAKGQVDIGEVADVNWRELDERVGGVANCAMPDFAQWVGLGKRTNIEALLSYTKNGAVAETPLNYRVILENSPEYQSVCLNEHSGRIEVLEPEALPWTSRSTSFTDHDMTLLKQIIGEQYGIYSDPKMKSALLMVANKRGYHPIKDYFERIMWDGTPRLDSLFIDLLDADDNAYTREASRKIFMAAVARTYSDQVKFDQMLVLVGKQGAGKSTLLKKMGKQWFTDQLSVPDMKDPKKAGEQIEGKLIVEVQELAGLRNADAEVVKSFISSESERYRAAYGHNAEDRPRRSVLFGTTNETSGFLMDTTGNRRFWPIHINAQNARRVFALTDAEVDQYWAEAVHYYRQSQPLTLSAEAASLAESAQKDSLETDERVGLVENYLNDNKLKVTCGLEIWIHVMHGNRDRFTGRAPKQMQRILQQVDGWEATGKLQRLESYGRQYTFRKVE